MRTLILAEKPSVARDIARVLGCNGRGAGFLQSEQYVVTWAIGHLVSLCEPDELDPAYKRWRMEQLPILPDQLKTKVLPKTKAQYAVIKSLLNQADIDRVICATDSGREGELIFRYIYQQAKCKKPVDRLWISSMTDAAIRDGFDHLKPDAEYDSLYASARCRSEADWLVGMNASRAFTLKYNALLSVGRVQTPTLRLIVQRDKEIQAFVPEDYFEVRANFADYEGLWQDPEKEDCRCRDAELAKRIAREVKGQTATVLRMRREARRTPPPQLFDLTALQREVNRLMGLSAAKTLEIVQDLYEKHKLVTYPRTDSRYLPHDMIPKVTQTLSTLPDPWRSFSHLLLPNPPVSGRVYNDAKVSDHHAIVPTGQYTNLGRLNPQESRIYDMIARRLVASLYPDYEYESVLVLTGVQNHIFRTTGATPIKAGWKALYQDERDERAEKDEQEKEIRVPQLSEGETRTVEDVVTKKCKTKPPSPHTDASLLAMMERAGKLIEDEALKETMKDSGLGTPATRAAIIERLIQVGYVRRKGKAINATEKGTRLIDAVPDQIASPEMTGKWERALSSMAKEKDQSRLSERRDKFMQSIRRYAVFLVDAAKQADETIQFEREPSKKGAGKKTTSALGRRCPLCGEGEVTANQKAFGCSRWQEGCQFTVWRDGLVRQGGPSITVNDMKALLDGKDIVCAQGTIRLVGGRVALMRNEAPPPEPPPMANR